MFGKNKNQNKERVRVPFLPGNYLKTFVFLVVSLFVVFANFFIEGRLVAPGTVTVNVFESFNYSQENYLEDRSVVRFFNESVENSVFMREPYNSGVYIMDVESGHFWGNYSLSSFSTNIVAGRLVVIPDKAVFDFEYDGQRMDLAVYGGDVYVGILPEGIALEGVADQYSQLFVNKILVTSGSKVEIPVSKLDERINQLLYSKLVKEFKYSFISDEDMSDEWISTNIKADKKYIEGVKQRTRSDILYKGKVVVDGFAGKFVFWSEDNFTFIPGKKERIVFDHLFGFLDNSIFYATEGDMDKAFQSLDDFDFYYSSLDAEIREGERYFSKFDSYINELSVFGPDDEQNKIYLNLLERRFSDNRDRFEVVDLFWNEVYEALNYSDVAAADALDSYYRYFDSTMASGVEENFYTNYITFNNQRLDNLFLKNSIFYKDSYFAIKNAVEQELLRLYPDGRLKDELRQDLISRKIDFLKRLRNFFFEGVIDIPGAKTILSRLVEEIDNLMSIEESQVAVTELFESELNNIGDFWGYLNSPEYHTSQTYGVNHQERYQSYLLEKDRIWSFINIQQEVLGDAVGDLSVAEVEDEIKSRFRQSQSISQIEVQNIIDSNQRYVDVSGVIGGYPFEAVYDRDQDTLKDVYTYGELVSDRSIQLERLLEVLKGKFADFVEVPAEGEQFTEETFAQRAARLYIADLIKKFGFTVEIEDVSVVDELNALYRIKDVYIGGEKNILVTFDFLMNGEVVTNLFIQVRGNPLLLDGKFTLDELTSIVYAEGDLSVIDKGEEGNSTGVLR